MNAKFLAVGTVLGAVFLFVWGAVYHSLTPPEVQGLNAFRNKSAVMDAIKANAPHNGVYFLGQGVWAAVSFQPDLADKTQNMGPYLVKEVFTDLFSALFLALLVLQTRSSSAPGRAGALVLAALAAGMENQVSDWNWYGFSARFTVFELVDIVVSWFLVGLILAALARKLAPEAAPRAV
jgi:hypothetical protein